jgi:hypothetical protein
MIFEIAKRTITELLVYAIIGCILLIILGFLDNIVDVTEGTGSVVFISVILFFLWLTFKIVPNIPFKKHEKIGIIHFEIDSVRIELEGYKKIFLISNLEKFRIKLFGYDGQHMLGDIKSIGSGNASMYSDMRPVNGLGNKISFISEDQSFSFEFYVDKISDYNELKELISTWKQEGINMKSRIVR